MKVAILGTGAYGLSLALMFYENTHNITMWTKFEEEKEILQNNRGNETLLPGVTLPQEISITTNLNKAVANADLIFIAVPAKAVESLCCQLVPLYKTQQHICIGTKGIQQNTCKFIHNVVEQYLQTDRLAVISGPSFAVDIASYVPIGLTLATQNLETEQMIKKSLENRYLKLRVTDDILGVEICGAIKNVIALASGMLSGMNLPISTKAMFITESLHDIKALIRGLGGNGKTILSFAGFGDLLLTCTSEKSRNFTFGQLFGSKRSKAEIEAYKKRTTIEGLYTLESIYQLIQDQKIDIPMIDLIYQIIHYQKPPEALLTFLIEKQ